MAHDVTIFIPTYNRAALLARTIRFLQHDASLRLPIVVADGSEPSTAAQNGAFCKTAGTNIDYFHLPQAESENGGENYMRRCVVGLARARTPYTAFCADDDLLLPETAVKAGAFLADNPGYVGCQGMYFNFRYRGERLRIDGKGYDGPSIDGAEIGSRLMQFYARYEAPYYAVFRTTVQQDIFERARDIPTPMLVETFHSAAVVAAGKLKRLNDIYYLRNLGEPPHARPIDAWDQWLAADFDDFFAHYRAHRSKLIDFITSRSGSPIDLARLKHAIDMSFVVYMGREFRLNYWIDEYLATAIADPAERFRLRQQLAESPLNMNQAPLDGFLKASAKRLIKKVFRRKGINIARQIISTPEITLPEMVSLEQNPLVRAPRALVAGFSAADWEALCRRVKET